MAKSNKTVVKQEMRAILEDDTATADQKIQAAKVLRDLVTTHRPRVSGSPVVVTEPGAQTGVDLSVQSLLSKLDD